MEYVVTVAIWIGMGVLCEYLGGKKGRKNCFWWGFFLGLIGVVVVCCLSDQSEGQESGAKTNTDKYEGLQKLQQLKESGAITDVEFEIEKQKILK